MIESRLLHAQTMFELSLECGEDLVKIKTAFDGLKLREKQESFLKFFTDDQIIKSGIFASMSDLTTAFPNLRY